MKSRFQFLCFIVTYISYITCFVFVKLPRLLTKSRLVICRVIPSRNNLRYLKPLPWLRQRPLSAAVYLPSLSEHFMYTAANLILFSLLYFNLWGFVVFTETMRNVFFDFWSLGVRAISTLKSHSKLFLQIVTKPIIITIDTNYFLVKL